MKPSNSRRIITEQRCQPEPDRPLSIERLRGRLVEMHRLRVELAGKFEDFLARHVARSERAETAGLEVFEGQRGHAWGKLPEGSPIVAVICGNLNPTIRMAHAHADSRRWSGLVRGDFQG